MGYEQVLYEIKEGVGIITLNRPEKLNAFTGTMGEELWDAFNRALADDEVRAIVFTGAGRAFCAGVDLKALSKPGEGEKISGGDFIRKFPATMDASPKPSVCAMNGAAIGVGVTMAVSFDIRIAAEDAQLAVPFSKLGILAGFGSSHLLPKLVGRANALDLLLTARTVLGPEALEMGLVNRVVPADQVLPSAVEIAKAMAAHDPLVIEHCKQLINDSSDASIAEALANETRIGAALRAAKAARDGS